jgi:TRAP-type C4-dicarboxylate transport system permease small subunit
MNILTAIENAISRGERVLLVLIMLVLLGLAFLQVILRNVFSEGILWADPFLRHIVMWAGFLGASLATQGEKHISMDIVSRFAGPKTVGAIKIATYGAASIICFLLARAGMTFLVSEIETADILITIGSMELPAWWFQLIIPIGFGLMSLRFLFRVIENISYLITGKTPAPAQREGAV